MKPKSEIMQEMRAARVEAGLKRYEVWLPATRDVAKALKTLEGMDSDSISALLSDNTCPVCGQYSPFSERSGPDAKCKECAAAEYRKLLNT